MSYDPRQQSQAAAYGSSAQIDVGLQSHMRHVYNTMGLGLVATGVSAWTVAHVPAVFNMIFGTPLAFVVMFAPLAFIFFGFSPSRMQRWPVGKIRTMFYVFAALMGLSLSTIFKVYTDTSIVRAFLIAAGMFAATSIYGYTTRRDLTGLGSFMFMGLIGILIASIVNLFMASSMVAFAASFLGVFIFTGLAAFETQRIKETYAYGNHMQEANDKMAVLGALGLYLNFINLFQSLLHLLNNQR